MAEVRAFQISENEEESKDNKRNSMAGLNSWLIDPEPARRNTVTVMNETPTDKNSRRKNKSFKVNLNKLNDEKIFGK